jgi:hypothetical protein
VLPLLGTDWDSNVIEVVTLPRDYKRVVSPEWIYILIPGEAAQRKRDSGVMSPAKMGKRWTQMHDGLDTLATLLMHSDRAELPTRDGVGNTRFLGHGPS